MASKIGKGGKPLLNAMANALDIEGVKQSPSVIDTDAVLPVFMINGSAEPSAGRGLVMVGREVYSPAGANELTATIIGRVFT